jgi:hypothetical protein
MALGSMIVRGITVSSEKMAVSPGKMKMTSMAEMWPQKLIKRKDGFWVECRDVTCGPYESKGQAVQDMGRLQTEICGWADPENAKVYPEGGHWVVDRWTQVDEFETEEEARAHKARLIREKESV